MAMGRFGRAANGGKIQGGRCGRGTVSRAPVAWLLVGESVARFIELGEGVHFGRSRTVGGVQCAILIGVLRAVQTRSDSDLATYRLLLSPIRIQVRSH
jgi:hypothetical protein